MAKAKRSVFFCSQIVVKKVWSRGGVGISQKRKQIEDLAQKRATGGKKFVRLVEGAELMSLGLATFKRLAREGNATYKVGKIILVNMDILEEYLEQTYRESEVWFIRC